MMRFLITLFLLAACLQAQYTAQPAGAPPSEAAPEIAAELQPQGTKIAGAGGQAYAELWFRKSGVDGPPTGEIDVSWNTVAHGSLIGVLRYPGAGQDRRGQEIKPGVYTLRFSFYPVDGAHQGVEPSRDFLILSPAATDRDPKATPSFAELMKMSSEASGRSHPASLAMWKGDGSSQEGLSKAGEEDWVLTVKIGETPISIIVKGVNPHG